ncbi:MAG: KamA family radical SAM protein [Desulfobacteraceae bacterium]|nr:KamA family radical SAM protein [Desulfobacteraceae bacterium]
MPDISKENADPKNNNLDTFTKDFFDTLFKGKETCENTEIKTQIKILSQAALDQELTSPIIALFSKLKTIQETQTLSPKAFGLSRKDLTALALKHENIDEHDVSVGGRVCKALPIVEEAIARVDEYLSAKTEQAPSGFELWDSILETQEKIKSYLDMTEQDWNSYSGQIKHCIDTVEDLSKVIDLPEKMIKEVTHVTQDYRMRLTPYYASLIQARVANDPVLLQSVPTGEMVDNLGIEIPPVAADHSPARLIDQFYPRVVTIKATNMCAMYCTHCLRLAHIGKKDRIYTEQAYEEALDYIRNNDRIRDILITGGDAFVLPNKILKKILGALDEIDHVKMKRLGTRIPVTAPQRVDNELLDILAQSNDKKPVRVVTQINTAQEMTPLSGDAFKRISKNVFAVLNQAVLLKGINDTKVKMWKLCETIQENYVRPYYLFNCSYRNPQFAHFRVPVEKGRDIIESMYGNISGDAIPRYIATAGGKIPLHRSNVEGTAKGDIILKKPWNGEVVNYPDADTDIYENKSYAFMKP